MSKDYVINEDYVAKWPRLPWLHENHYRRTIMMKDAEPLAQRLELVWSIASVTDRHRRMILSLARRLESANQQLRSAYDQEERKRGVSALELIRQDIAKFELYYMGVSQEDSDDIL